MRGLAVATVCIALFALAGCGSSEKFDQADPPATSKQFETGEAGADNASKSQKADASASDQ